jgi:hypothetical protein
MDIASQTEILLRDAGYETWLWTGPTAPVVVFESQTVAGFVHVFADGQALLKTWFEAQRQTLDRHALLLRAAGDKAWNVYAVFLAGTATPDEIREIERLDEDFALTRKIGRANLQVSDELRTALLPLLPIQSSGMAQASRFEDLLRGRVKNVPEKVVDAFLGPAKAADVAHMIETEI